MMNGSVRSLKIPKASPGLETAVPTAQNVSNNTPKNSAAQARY